MAVENGLAKSDHTYLDGSNYDEKDKVSSDAILLFGGEVPHSGGRVPYFALFL
jgi:hypothetical protein